MGGIEGILNEKEDLVVDMKVRKGKILGEEKRIDRLRINDLKEMIDEDNNWWNVVRVSNKMGSEERIVCWERGEKC